MLLEFITSKAGSVHIKFLKMSVCAGKSTLLPRLLWLLLLLLCANVQAHGDIAVTANDLVTTVKGRLVIVTALVGCVVIVLLSVLTICCWYNHCKVAKLQHMPGKKLEEGGVKLTMIERTDESWSGGGEEGNGEGGESKVTTVQVELEAENTLATFGHSTNEKKESSKDQQAKDASSEQSKKAQGTEESEKDDQTKTGDENKQKDGVEAAGGQGGASVPQAIPVPPPIMLDLSPAILKQKSASSEPGTTDVNTAKVKPVKQSSAPSIMLELSRAILKPRLVSTGASGEAKNKATKETPSSEAKATTTDEKSDSPEEKKSEVVLSLEEATPKPTEQDTEIPQKMALMNFEDIDSALGQALKDLGDF